MKKSFIYFIAVVNVCLLITSSCKKDKSSDSNVTPTTNVLCDGNGTTTYFPLVLNNSWTYNYYIASQSQNVHPKLVVMGTSTHNSKSYFKIEDETSAMYVNEMEYREDATSHNIYYYNSNYATEYLYVPASPTLNQSWQYSGGNTRKVTSISATLTTTGCSYTGLLEITEYNSSNSIVKKEYFKKGIGLISQQYPDSFFGGYDKYSLSSITLH